jgi:hypothetical protein
MNDLPIWVIYDHPTDQPEFYIARKWLIRWGNSTPTPTAELRAGLTLAEVRNKLPYGLVRLERNPNDDAKIVESWI